MKTLIRIALCCGLCGTAWALETNLLVYAYSASIAPQPTYPDPGVRILNNGDWSASDRVRFDSDVSLTLDLLFPTYVDQVRVYSQTAGASKTASVALACSEDGTSWYGLGSLQDAGAGLFTNRIVFCRVRYLRVACRKDATASYQDLTEIVVNGRQSLTITPGLVPLTYTSSQMANPNRGDSATTPKLTDGVFNSATVGTVQYGPSSTSDITAHPDDERYLVATNLALRIDFGGGTTTVERLTRVSLYSHASTNNGTWGTDGMIVSNSVDGNTWQFIATQTNFTVLPGDQYGVIRRFDVLLPYSTSRSLTVVGKKQAKTSVLRQLLAEVHVESSTLQTNAVAGAPIPYTYTLDKATSVSNENPYAPKLTDFCYEHVTRHALRFYEQTVNVISDLGYPQYIHSGLTYTWGSPTKYGNSADYYGTEQVDCYGSLDGQSWTFFGSLEGPVLGTKQSTFTSLPCYRYVKTTYTRAASFGTNTVSSQIIGELTFYGLPKQSIGELQELPGVIPFAGFETTPQLDVATLVRGGSTNGWTFSYLDDSNYTGIQINGSPVSSNSLSLVKYFTSEGVQTAVMRGTNVSMQTQITVPVTGHYLLRMQASSLACSTTGEQSGYNFRVGVDGTDKGLVNVMTLPPSKQQVYLGVLEAGTHTLRFDGVNSRNSPAGTLIDDLKLFRIPDIAEVPGAQIRKSQSVVMVSTEPVALNYVGPYYIRNWIVDGVSVQHRIYSAENTPSLLSGFGTLQFEDGLTVLIQ